MLNRKFDKMSSYPAGTLFVGIDIAKGKHCARAVNNLDNLESKPVFFSNRRKGFEKLLGQIGIWLRQFDCSTAVIGMEPTAGYWEPIYCHLEETGFEVRLVSSLKVKRSKDLKDNSPLKSDEKDALLIADLLRSGNDIDLRREDNEMEVKTLLKLADDLEKTAGVYRNLVENFLSVHFPEFSEVIGDLSSPTARKLLKKFPFPADVLNAGFERMNELLQTASHSRINPDKAMYLIQLASESIGVKQRNEAERVRIRIIMDLLEMIHSRLSEVKNSLEKKVESHPMYEILHSVKGVGVMTSAAIIASLGDLRKYDNYRQVLKKVGLNLYRFSSGKYRGVDRISRRGMALLRKYLFMSALCNCRDGSVFYDKYRSLVEGGVAKKKAIVGIMRKLLKLLYALVRDNRKFESDYVPRGAKSDVIVIKRVAA